MTRESGAMLQSDHDIPTVAASEAAIAEDAPAALRVLASMGALDVAEALGVGEVPC